MSLDPFFLMGVAGMTAILTAFAMVQGHRWTQDDMIYDILNLIGSALLVVYGIAGKAWPFVILNGIWALYSLKDVMQNMMSSKKS